MEELIKEYPELESVVSVLNINISRGISENPTELTSDYVPNIGLGLHEPVKYPDYWKGITDGISYYYSDLNLSK